MNHRLRECLLLFSVLLAFFSIGLGARDYLTPSEARYIEIPREMLATGDWLTPRINGVPYFEKPPLFYWMQAAVIYFLGTGEFAGRLATALLAALTGVITYATARTLYGRLAGWMAACVLATCLMGYALSRVATLDLPVGLFITASISCFLMAQHRPHRRTLYLLMYVASALAVMTKGLIGMVIPGMVIGAWITATGRWHILKEARLVSGLLLFLAIALPWHGYMAQRHPQFLDFYFIHEHFLRYMETGHRRMAPWWFFIAVTLAGLMPWTGLLPAALRRLQYKHPDTLFLLMWIVLPLTFFSASHSKLLSYIFLVFPPLAILMGRTLAGLWHGELPQAYLRQAVLLAILVFSALIAAVHCLPMASDRLDRLGGMGSLSPLALLPVAFALAWLAYALLRRYNARTLIVSLAAFGGITGLNLNYMQSDLGIVSVKPLARQLAPRLKDGDLVMAYANYWQDLPVYLNRTVTVAEWRGELDFGLTHYPETHEWMITYAQFWERCRTHPQAVYVFAHEDTVKELTSSAVCRLKPAAKYGKTVLLERVNPNPR